MQNNKLEILVTAKDAASDVISGVGKSFGHLSDAAVTGSKAMLAGVTVAAAGVVAFGKSSVDAYNGAAEASAKLATNLLNVKGNTQKNVDELEGLASKLQSIGVIEDDVIKAGMSQLATFNLQSSTIGILTPKIADMVAQMKGHNATAEDMVAVNNLVGKVMTGNVGALSRYGVTLSDTQAELIKNGNETQRANVLNEVLAQNYGKVNEELRKTPQGMWTGIKNDLGDLQEGVGELIVAGFMPLARTFSDWMSKVNEAGGLVQYFSDLIKNNQGAFIALAGALTAMLLPAIVSIVASAAPMILGLAALAAIGALLAPVINDLANKFGGWGAIMDKAKSGFNTVVLGVKALVGAFKDGDVTSDGFVGKMEQAGVILRQVWEGLKDTGVALWNAIKMAIDFLKPSFEALWQTIQNNLWPALQNLWNLIQPYIIPTLQVLGAIIGGVLVAAIWIAVNVLNVIIQVVSWLINVIVEIVQKIVWFASMIVQYLTFVYNFWSAIFNAIYEVVKFVFQLIAVAIATVISVIMAIVQPIANALSAPFRTAWDWIRGVWSGVAGWFSGIVSQIGGVLGGVTRAITAPFEAAFNWVKDLPGRIVGAVGNIGGLLRDKLGDWDIPGPLGKVRDVIPGFASGVNNFGGGLAVVGEKGPELVNLPRGADVVGNHQLAGLGGMGGVHIEIHGNIVNETPEAADRFMDRLNRMATLNEMGVAV